MPQKLLKLIESLVAVKSDTGISEKSANGNSRHQADVLNLHELRILEPLPVLSYILQPLPPFLPIYLSSQLEIFGYSVKEWKNEPAIWSRLIHSEDISRVHEHLQEAIDTLGEINIKYRLRGKDGNIFWVNDRGRAVVREGEVTYFQGLIADISEQKRVEEELLRREYLYRTISRNLPNTAIFIRSRFALYTCRR